LTKNQIVRRELGGKHPGKPKEEASHQEQTHKAVEGKENHPDYARNPGTIVVVGDYAGTVDFDVICSNDPFFPL
jgi:hypothetical protein